MTLYNKLILEDNGSTLLKLLWKSANRLKHKIFSWLMFQNRINTRSLLQRKGMHLGNYDCVCCRSKAPETPLHLFWDCTFAHSRWVTLFPFKQRGTSIYEDTFLALEHAPQHFGIEIITLGYWHIWNQRNGKIFRNERPTIQGWRRNLKSDLLFLQYRIKNKFKNVLLDWITVNLD